MTLDFFSQFCYFCSLCYIFLLEPCSLGTGVVKMVGPHLRILVLVTCSFRNYIISCKCRYGVLTYFCCNFVLFSHTQVHCRGNKTFDLTMYDSVSRSTICTSWSKFRMLQAYFTCRTIEDAVWIFEKVIVLCCYKIHCDQTPRCKCTHKLFQYS